MKRFIFSLMLLFSGFVNASDGLIIRESDMICLSKNIYFEARNQSVEGMYAVAKVTMNRVFDKRFPNSVCGVVKQKSQFSWYWDGLSDIPRENASWKASQTIAKLTLINYFTMHSPVGDSVFYHAHYVEPYWSHKLTKVAVIDDHIFYK